MRKLLTFLLALTFSLGFVACNNAAKEDSASDNMEEAVDDAGDEMEEAADDVEDAADDAADEVEDEVDSLDSAE